MPRKNVSPAHFRKAPSAHTSYRPEKQSMFHLMDSVRSGSHPLIHSRRISHNGRETSGQVYSRMSGFFVRDGRQSMPQRCTLFFAVQEALLPGFTMLCRRSRTRLRGAARWIFVRRLSTGSGGLQPPLAIPAKGAFQRRWEEWPSAWLCIAVSARHSQWVRAKIRREGAARAGDLPCENVLGDGGSLDDTGS